MDLGVLSKAPFHLQFYALCCGQMHKLFLNCNCDVCFEIKNSKNLKIKKILFYWKDKWKQLKSFPLTLH